MMTLTDLTLKVSSPIRKKIPDVQHFLKDISGTEPAGTSLRYDSLYDEVRLARQEDDPRLSMGIWETELKRADWVKIEELCLQALMERSKDIQIGAWLLEAWIGLDGITGYIHGISLLTGLCETFWPILHPQPEENGDMERRLMIFEWMDSTLSARLMATPLTQSEYTQTGYGLGHLKSARHTDMIERRAEAIGKKSTQSDHFKISVTIEDFQKNLEQTLYPVIVQKQQNLAEALRVTLNFKRILSAFLSVESPSFSLILTTLKDMERVMFKEQQSRPEPVEEAPEDSLIEPAFEDEEVLNEAVHGGVTLPVQPASLPDAPMAAAPIRTRHDAYRQLEKIAAFLKRNDPHSPAHQLLHQLILWENKNIIDIFGEVSENSQELSILMKLLGNPSAKG
jgi:type VI secretion system protein ImpA